MEVMSAISTRRCVRKYTGVPITKEELETVLRAGFQGPSAHNLRPMSFVVVNDKLKLEELSAVHRYAKMLPEAGCGVVVCGDIKRQTLESFLIQDCSAAIENMLLAAHNLNLGAVWCGLHPVKELTEDFSRILKLPENIIPIGLVVLGNKAEEPVALNRYDESKIHYNNW